LSSRAILIVFGVVPFLLKGELLPIRTYTAADGLAGDHINCIVPDSRGFIWFCTPEGLSRFDGYRFTSYGVKDGLAHRSVSTLVETHAGEYFVGTARGVSRINAGGPGPRFTTYAPEHEAALNSVAELRESRTGKIWYATARSLFEWNGANDFRRTQLLRPPNGRITSIVEDPHGELWIGTIDGMYLLDDSGISQSLTVENGLPGKWVEALLLDSQGRLWAAVRGGLVLITRKAAHRWGVDKVYTDRSGLAGSDVKALAEASDGTLWVGTTMGISRLSLRSAEPAVLQNLTRAQGLSDRSIVALAEDQSGNIWAGTEGAGVMRIDRLGFTTYREQDGFPTDRLFSVFEDRDGELLAVTLGARGRSERAINIFDGAKFHSVAPKPLASAPAGDGTELCIRAGRENGGQQPRTDFAGIPR
jgi:ligand-binding sensor domain-containing protein